MAEPFSHCGIPSPEWRPFLTAQHKQGRLWLWLGAQNKRGRHVCAGCAELDCHSPCKGSFITSLVFMSHQLLGNSKLMLSTGSYFYWQLCAVCCLAEPSPCASSRNRVGVRAHCWLKQLSLGSARVYVCVSLSHSRLSQRGRVVVCGAHPRTVPWALSFLLNGCQPRQGQVERGVLGTCLSGALLETVLVYMPVISR